jgi:TonB family C-terminal domain
MKRLAGVGGFLVVSFLAPAFGAAQIPNSDNVYVLQAIAHQPTTTAPLTLTFSEPSKQGRKRIVKQTDITIPATDVIDSLTTRVRAQKFERESAGAFLFVLDVRGRNVPAKTGDPLVLTLASGAVVAISPGCVHAAATRWLRVNLPSETKVSASAMPLNDPNKSDAARPADQSPPTGSSVQFDAKGVDFSPWLRRFVGQIRRNWFVPESALREKGQVVVTFRVDKTGRITDVAVRTPSSVAAFNNSAFGAVLASNPTVPLPPEYPDESAFFTVTFYFNESPPKG